MEKTLLLVIGALLVVASAVAWLSPSSGLTQVALAVSGLCGVATLVLAGRIASEARGTREPAAAIEKEAPAPRDRPVEPAPRAEAEVVAFLALLQEGGRLVDFVREDLAGASDAQIGAAARVVHAGCRRAIDEHFEIEPVAKEPEGTEVVLESGYDASAYRLLGTVPDQPPYRGKLLHPGWAIRSVKLPRVTGVTEERPWPVVAPAEVDLGKG